MVTSVAITRTEFPLLILALNFESADSSRVCCYAKQMPSCTLYYFLLYGWNKNVNNHWVESNRIYGSCLHFCLFSRRKNVVRTRFSRRCFPPDTLYFFSLLLTVSPWKIKDRKNKRFDTLVTHARVMCLWGL